MKIYSCIVFFTVNFLFSFAETPEFRIKKVVIDAGHGGKDPGCLGASIKEKEVCLSIALNLGKYIAENFSNVEVIYTRKTDIFLELHERAKIANDNKADLFICIHANSGPASVFGTETYVMGLHKSEANLEVAKRENSAILMEDNYKVQYEGFDPNSDESYIALSLLQGAHFEKSLNFASKFQKQMSRLDRHNRGVKQAGFLVLYRTAMPSVLIETGFLTNKEEEKFLADSVCRAKMAYTIFEAFKEYKNEMEKNFHEENVVIENPKQEKELLKKEESEKIETDQLIFKVQVASSPKKIPKNAERFRGLDYIVEYMDGTSYKYVIGNEKSISEATLLQKKIKEQGYSDAFVVAFYKEKRITLAEANKILSGKL